MAEKCIVCGKSYDNMAINSNYPKKPICLLCLNGYILNLNTIEKELDPFFKAIKSTLEDIDKKL